MDGRIDELNLKRFKVCLHQSKSYCRVILVLYIMTRVWVLHTSNGGQNMHFQLVSCKKAENRKKKQYNRGKTKKILSLHSNNDRRFYSQKKNIFRGKNVL